ncbi:MAG: SDR family NAD(P)-dependent oxidoreductase, partial [Treponema sp.]|nr:SDR family NAD(P)-dependent oxidoreductase [Treponema sp.]
YHFLPKMQARGFGRIVNTTSGIRLEPEQAGYSASKAALDKVTMDIAQKVNGTNVCVNITDPGWCRTDLGGKNAPNSPESSLPGVVVGAFVDDKKSGRNFAAQLFHSLSLEEAVKKAETEIPVYTGTIGF